MVKGIANYLSGKIVKHSTAILSVLTLAALLAALLFLYRYLYQPMNTIADIYTLKGQINFSIIDEKLFNEIYSGIQTKTQPPLAPIDNLNSPF